MRGLCQQEKGNTEALESMHVSHRHHRGSYDRSYVSTFLQVRIFHISPAHPSPEWAVGMLFTSVRVFRRDSDLDTNPADGP